MMMMMVMMGTFVLGSIHQKGPHRRDFFVSTLSSVSGSISHRQNSQTEPIESLCLETNKVNKPICRAYIGTEELPFRFRNRQNVSR